MNKEEIVAEALTQCNVLYHRHNVRFINGYIRGYATGESRVINKALEEFCEHCSNVDCHMDKVFCKRYVSFSEALKNNN